MLRWEDPSCGGEPGKKLMVLAHLLALDEDALICDLAETYHILD